VEYRLRRASDGAWRWHLSRNIPLFDDSGTLIKWFGIATDIESQKREEQVIRQSRDDLERAVTERTEELVATNVALRESEQVALRARENGNGRVCREADKCRITLCRS